MKLVVLDTVIIGLVTNPKQSPRVIDCNHWLQQLLFHNIQVFIPEIADYEVRGELLRANKTKGLERLDQFVQTLKYLPITTAIMRRAAYFWAQARQQGKPTAGDKTIDVDMILVAQAESLGGSDVVIATTNVRHLSCFVKADLWLNVQS